MTASRTVHIDLAGAATEEEIHNRIAQAFGFPDYYGRNWDAFDECIHDLSEPVGRIRIIGVTSFEAQFPREARLLRESFRDYQQSEDGRGVVVEIE